MTELPGPVAPPAIAALADDTNATAFQKYMRFALADLQDDYTILSFLPLPPEMLSESPDGILAPPSGRDTLDMREVERIVQQDKVVVAVCLLADDQEKNAARKILNQLHELESIEFVFAVLFVPSLASRADLSTLAARQDELLEMGASDVIVQPEARPGCLRSAVRLCHKTSALAKVRMEAMVEDEPLEITAEEYRSLQQREQRLLWRDLPAETRMRFPRVDHQVREDNSGFGQYCFVRQFKCFEGCVYTARDANQASVVVKVLSKSQVHSGHEIECIYREISFLGQVLLHPHIVRCIDAVNATEKFYMVLEYAGSDNLETICEAQPSECLDETSAIVVLKQVVSALAYMHEQLIVHRCVSLEHVAVKMQTDGYHCTLLDFRRAMMARGDVLSKTICGTLPCIAPEMFLSEAYDPRFVDAWSVGIVLLEVAGGLCSLFLCAMTDEAEENDSLSSMRAIVAFFASPNSHARALERKNGVHSPQVVECLKQLLLMPPSGRVPMRTLSASLNSD